MFRILSLAVMVGLYSFPLQAQTPAELASAYLEKTHRDFGLNREDIAEVVLTDWHQSSLSNMLHVYLQQEYNGIPVHNGLLSLHFEEQVAVVYSTNRFVADLKEKITHTSPQLSMEEAIAFTIEALVLDLNKGALKIKIKEDIKTHSFFQLPNSTQWNSIRLVYAPQPNETLTLAWESVIAMPDGEDVWQIRIDAVSGREIDRNNWVVSCHFEPECPKLNTNIAEASAGAKENILDAPAPPSFNGDYNIFPLPIESPLYGNRSLKSGSEIINSTASPHGWHDTDGNAASIEYDYTRGNNVYAYYAPTGTANNPTATPIVRSSPGNVYVSGIVPQPAGSSLNFNYSNNLNSANGTDFIEDAVTNLFAWNNICHDVFFLYGFNEAAGNFQQTNHSGSGLGDDYVLARAQDGSGLNNARFFTPPESVSVSDRNPIMRMFLWDSDLPNSVKDGDFDNLIITHEYGHGVSIRLVGGAANNSCLTNFEQGGEGWSDYFGLMFTMADLNGNGTIDANMPGEGIRSIGTYVTDQGSYGPGIRPAYYTNNMNCQSTYCNDFSYGDVASLAAPHGVGFLWCTMLWDMTLELISAYGYEPDIYNVSSTAGNIRAMKIVVEALKMTACQPSFIDMRDAVIAANTSLFGGSDNNLLWSVFARRGLGVNATANGNESFDDFSLVVNKTVNKEMATVGESVTYTISVKNNTNTTLSGVSISDPVPPNLVVTSVSNGGSVSNGSVVYPMVPSIAPGNTVVRTFSGNISAGSFTTSVYENPVESAFPTNFVSGGAWITSVDNPNPNSGSTRSWWHIDPNTMSEGSLILTLNLNGANNNHLSFWHYFDLEPGKDGGVIEIFTGTGWQDLDEKIIKNGYSDILLDVLVTPIGLPIPQSTLSGRRAFSGYSGGYIQTIIDLSSYTGTRQIRFRFASNDSNVTANCDGSTSGCDGWFLDDFVLYDLKNILNTAFATTSFPFISASGNVGKLGTMYFAGSLPVEWLSFTAKAREEDIQLDWLTESETDNQGFELQRREASGHLFKTIAWIDGKENTDQITDYQYFDKEVKPNVSYYYRLKQVDFDGDFAFSKIIEAKIEKPKEYGFSLAPNPTNDWVSVAFKNELSLNTKLDLIDAKGALIKSAMVVAGQQNFQLDCSALPPGVYFVRGVFPKGVQVEKLIKN